MAAGTQCAAAVLDYRRDSVEVDQRDTLHKHLTTKVSTVLFFFFGFFFAIKEIVIILLSFNIIDSHLLFSTEMLQPKLEHYFFILFV